MEYLNIILLSLGKKNADAAAALARVVAAIVETRAHRLQFGNTRYCIAKHFGYVLPTRALVRWLCDQFAGCERVVSVGAGSCFLEAAMQLEMRARGRATVLVCVENNVELIGHPAREAAAERSVEMVALGPDAAEGAGEHDNASTATGLRGFCCSPMKVVPMSRRSKCDCHTPSRFSKSRDPSRRWKRALPVAELCQKALTGSYLGSSW